MSSEALPYTLLLVLVEFTIGGLWVMVMSHARGNAAPSFVKFGAALTAVMAAITFWVSSTSIPTSPPGLASASRRW